MSGFNEVRRMFENSILKGSSFRNRTCGKKKFHMSVNKLDSLRRRKNMTKMFFLKVFHAHIVKLVGCDVKSAQLYRQNL